MTPTLGVRDLSTEVDLRRLRFFIGRIDYLRTHMAGGEQALLTALQKGAPVDFWESIDAAIDREYER